jgi:hypothetical protein
MIPPPRVRFQPSGWAAEQEAIREEAEREHYRNVAERDEIERGARGNVVRVIR